MASQIATIKSQVDPHLFPLQNISGVKQEERDTAVRKILEIAQVADETLQQQAEKINELTQQVEALKKQGSEQSSELIVAQEELKGLEKTSAETIDRLTKELKAKPEETDTSALEAQIEALEQRLRQGEEEVAQLKSQYGQNVAAFEAKQKVNEKVNRMSVEDMRARSEEVCHAEPDTINGHEFQVICDQLRKIDAQVTEKEQEVNATNTELQGKLDQAEWDKSTFGTMQRLISSLFAMV